MVGYVDFQRLAIRSGDRLAKPAREVCFFTTLSINRKITAWWYSAGGLPNGIGRLRKGWEGGCWGSSNWLFEDLIIWLFGYLTCNAWLLKNIAKRYGQ